MRVDGLVIYLKKFKKVCQKYSPVTISIIVIILSIVFIDTLNSYSKNKTVSENRSTVSPKPSPIVLIGVSFNRSKRTLAVKSVSRSTGYVPDYKNLSPEYFLVNVLKNKQLVKTYYVPATISMGMAPTTNSAGVNLTPPTEQIIIIPYIADTEIEIKKDYIFNTSTVTKQVAISSDTLNNLTEIAPTAPPQNTTSPEYQVETIYDGDPQVTDPAKTIDIVFFASGYDSANLDEYRNFILDQVDRTFGIKNYPGVNPYNQHKNLLKISSVVSTNSFHTLYNIPNRGQAAELDGSKIINMLSSLSLPYDYYIGVIGGTGISTGDLGGISISLFSKGEDSTPQPLLFTHEFTHNFAGLLDEYYWGNYSGDLSVMGKNCTDDPTDPWPGNISADHIRGCSYNANLYRSSEDSIMGGDGPNANEFNQVSKYLIEQAFSAYIENKASLFSYTNGISLYRDIKTPPTNYTGQLNFRSLNSSLSANYHVSISPSVNWLTLNKTDGELPAYLVYTVDYNQLSPGIYKTNFVVTIPNSSAESLTIPVKVVVSNYSQAPTVEIVSFAEGSTFKTYEPIKLEISPTNLEAFYKRIEYWSTSSYGVDEVAYSRTKYPYNGVVNPIDLMIGYGGSYSLYTKAYPYDSSFPPKLSKKVNFTISDTIADCPSPQMKCTNNGNRDTCYTMAPNCVAQGLYSCCPNIDYVPSPTIIEPSPTSVFPSPLPTAPYSTPTPIPTETNKYCNQLDQLIKNGFNAGCGEFAPDPNYDVRADLNKDQRIDSEDLSLFAIMKSQPNAENSCALKIGDNNNICTFSNACSVLYGKILNGYSTSCTNPTIDNKKYSLQADLNKDGKINGADFSLYTSIVPKDNDASCQSYLTDPTDPCVNLSPTPTPIPSGEPLGYVPHNTLLY